MQSLVLLTNLILFGFIFMKLKHIKLHHLNDEQSLALRQGFGNVVEIEIGRSKLTSVGMQAIATAIGNREFQVKHNILFLFSN